MVGRGLMALCVSLALASGMAAPPAVAQEAVSAASAPVLRDGTYEVEVELLGGSGRASLTSPTRLVVEGGVAYLTVEWSSPNYDYMIVDGERFLPENEGGNSRFTIPTSLGGPLEVIADTTAMSVPHEIAYTIEIGAVRDVGAGFLVPGAVGALALTLVLLGRRHYVRMRGDGTSTTVR